MNLATPASQEHIILDLPGKPYEVPEAPVQRSFVSRGAAIACFATAILVFIAVGLFFTPSKRDVSAEAAPAFSPDVYVDSPVLIDESSERKSRVILSIETPVDDPQRIPEVSSERFAPSKWSRIEQVTEKLEKMALLGDKLAELETIIPSRLVIAHGDDETSGFFREIPGQEDEHFLVVNSVNNEGEPVSREIIDMDTAQVHQVSTWAVLVSLDEFVRYSTEKSTTGSFQNPEIGRFENGQFGWNVETDSKYLVNWQEFAE